MKRFFIAAFVIANMCMVGCTNTPGDDPKTVAKHFFEAFKEMNTDEAAKYATRDSKTLLDLVKMGMTFKADMADSAKAELAKHKITYGEPVINGDEAKVPVSFDNKEKTDISLKKEDGLWKVAFDLSTLTNTGLEKMEQHGASPADMEAAKQALKAVNLDSLSDVLKEGGKAMQEASKELDSIK